MRPVAVVWCGAGVGLDLPGGKSSKLSPFDYRLNAKNTKVLVKCLLLLLLCCVF
jgi:hypothetical protein